MKIVTWNVNSVNARLPNITSWISKNDPDVVLLQELKCTDDKFPFDAFTEIGYHAEVFGQKSWNGVAILSKHEVTDVLKGLPGDDTDEQSRYIEATVKGIRIAGLYLPNGNPVDTEKYPYKLSWMDRLYTRMKETLENGTPAVFGGDYNIIPEDRDCYDPAAWSDDALFKLDSRKKFRALLNLGYTEAFRATNDNIAYSFWDYQRGAWQKDHGIRIDHFLLSPQATDLLKNCTIDKTPRAEEKASDHVPVILELSQ